MDHQFLSCVWTAYIGPATTQRHDKSTRVTRVCFVCMCVWTTDLYSVGGPHTLHWSDTVSVHVAAACGDC